MEQITDSGSSASVSVLFVSYNVKQYLIHAIEAVNKSDYSGAVSIIVTDNNSYDGSADSISQNFPNAKVIRNTVNVGFGKAVNQAVSFSDSKYLLLLNPDTVIKENTIQILANYLEENPTVGMVGPKIINADGSLQLACKRSFPTFSTAIPKILGLDKIFKNSKWAQKYNLNYLDENSIHSVDAISGSCMFISKELFDRIQGFDEQYFMFGEDLDLCYRIKNSGKEIHYNPNTQIIHYHGESVKSAPYDSIKAFYDAMILFSDKHFSKSQSFITRRAIRLGIHIRRLFSIIGEWKSQIISIFFDSLSVLIAFLIAIPIRFHDFEPIVLSRGLVPVVYILFWVMVGAVFQLYSRYILSYSRAIISSFTGFFLAAAFTYIFKQYAFSRLVIILATLIIVIMIPGWRIFVHYLMSRGVLRPQKEKHQILFTRKTVVLGADEEGLRIAKKLIRRFDTGLDIVGIVDDQYEGDIDNLPAPFLGATDDLRTIIKTYGIREIIFSVRGFTYGEILSIMEKTKDLALTYRMVPQDREIMLGKNYVEEIGDFSFVNIEYTLFRRFHRYSKRLFDLLLSTLLIILFSPLFIFNILMKKGIKTEFWKEDGRIFIGHHFKSDSKFIMKLPLYWSILKGDLSFVGSILVDSDQPNPELLCMPGLTGLARIRNTHFIKDERKYLDHYYVQNQSFTLDLEIIMKTLIK